VSTDTTVVITRHGKIRGEDVADVKVWRGIPYARPPAGDLRLRPPRPAADWPGIRRATVFSAVGWQSEAPNPFTGEAVALDRSEDCLYLNVTAPAASSPDPAGYPVLVWVHAGGYVQGSGPDGVEDGAGMARHGIIVVTFNYRLGSLGFLHLVGVLDPGDGGCGSAGFLDQVAALRWVKNSIAGFGGDPARITVYGVSAGAKSVANLIASPLTRGVISRAVSSSGGDFLATPRQAARLRRRFLGELGLGGSNARLLRSVPPEDLIGAQEAIASGAAASWVWRPVLGSTGIPVSPAGAICGGAAAGIAILLGSNGNEGATFQLMDPATAAQAPRVLADLFGAAGAQAMLDAYAASRPELSQAGVGLAVLGDERYGIPTHRLALAQAAHGPVWRYRYDSCPPGLPPQLAGGHGLDQLAIWAADGYRQAAGAGDPAAALTQAMARAWARFITGHPPGAGARGQLPAWPRFEPDSQLTMILDDRPHIEPRPRHAETSIWQDRTWTPGTWWHLDGLAEP
jgi:para-nitrobenzyl esterase